MKDILLIIFDYLDLKNKFKVAKINKTYLNDFNLYKKHKLYTNSNINQLVIVFNKWKTIHKNIYISNSWSPKQKPFEREILLF